MCSRSSKWGVDGFDDCNPNFAGLFSRKGGSGGGSTRNCDLESIVYSLEEYLPHLVWNSGVPRNLKSLWIIIWWSVSCWWSLAADCMTRTCSEVAKCGRRTIIRKQRDCLGWTASIERPVSSVNTVTHKPGKLKIPSERKVALGNGKRDHFRNESEWYFGNICTKNLSYELSVYLWMKLRFMS